MARTVACLQFIGSCIITGIDKVKVKYNEMESNRYDKKISENNVDKTIDLLKIPELINKFDFFFAQQLDYSVTWQRLKDKFRGAGM